MASPKEGIFPITRVPTRERPPPVPDSKPKVEPTTMPSEKRGKPPSKKRLGLYVRLAGALLAIAGTAGMGVKYHLDFDVPNTPAGIWQDVKGILPEYPYTIVKWQQDRAVDKRLEKPVSSTFNNEVDDQIIQAGVNAIPVSQEELPVLLKDTIKPVEKGKFPNPTIFLPLNLADGEKVDVQTYWVKNAYNPINPESKDPIAYGKIFTIAKKGTKIIVPVENAEVFIGTRNVNGQEYVSGLSVNFRGPDNTPYTLGFMSSEDVRGLQPTSIIKEALTAGKKKVNVPLNTPIATTSFNNLVLKAYMWVGEPPNDLHSNFDLITKEENGKTVVTFLP